MFFRRFNLSVTRLPIVLNSSIRNSSRFQSENKDREGMESEKSERALKKWRKPDDTSPHPMRVFDFTTKRDDELYAQKLPLKPSEFKKWLKSTRSDYEKWSQRFIAERHNSLGNDLAVTHFILYRGGRIRRKGHSEFLGPEDKEQLPSSFDPMWMVEEIDASGMGLRYEGLENFKDLKRLKKASFRGCQYFDDWCLERVLALCPNIEILDVSDCEKVTERGLEGIYRAFNLKTLILTDFKSTAAFELTVLLLEDTRPDLQVQLKQPSGIRSDLPEKD